MFYKKLLKQTISLYRCHNNSIKYSVRNFHKTLLVFDKNNENIKKIEKEVMKRISFDDVKDKNRNSYLEMVKIFVNRDTIYRRGHVEFIYSALRHMEEFGVHKDLEVYKALIDVLPKGKFVATNIIQAEFMHYPKQQQCIIDLLEQMEEHGVMPDFDMEDMLLNIFGKRAYPLRKYWRLMYWMPKFKNLSPWPVPNPLPDDSFELAKIAIERISSADPQAKITVYESSNIKDSIDDTWIVSSQSHIQQRLLADHNVDEPIYVEGSFKVWLKHKSVDYFILRGKPKPIVDDTPVNTDDVSNIKIPFLHLKPPVQKHLKVVPSVHEQEDGVIFSMCATGTSSKDSLLSWIRSLENDGNSILASVPIVFTLRSSPKELVNVENTKEKENQDKIEE